MAANDDHFEPPKIQDFFPDPVLFGGTPFELNRVMIIRLLAVAVLALWLWAATRRMRIVPGRFQAANEFLLGFVRNSIAIETLGEKDGRRYLPIIMTMFFLVFSENITGAITPLLIPGSSTPGQPLILALIAWALFIYAGVREKGAKYFKDALFVPGVPWFLYFLLTPLELLSTFIVRPVTLMLRLLMNMVAGHLLLALVYAASSYFLFVLLPQGHLIGLLGIGTVGFGLAYLGFEIFVAALQAYVFAFLTAIYIQLAVAEEH